MGNNRYVNFFRDERTGAFFMLIAGCAGFLAFNLGLLDASMASFKQSVWPLVSQFGMALFFVLIGFELRSEFNGGLFSRPKAALVPAFAALFGVLVPAVVFVGMALIARASNEVIASWPIVTATDVSFALMAFSVLAKSLPSGLRAFLLSFAVIDDIIATIALAVGFHKIEALTPLLSTAFALVLAFSLSASRVEKAMRVLSPFVAFIVLPLFAFLAMQISFDASLLFVGTSSVLWPLILVRPITKWFGVFLGATIGNRVMSFENRIALTTRDFFRVTSLAGIGFTVSLLAADFAFGSGSKLFAAAATLTVVASLSAVIIAAIALKVRQVAK